MWLCQWSALGTPCLDDGDPEQMHVILTGPSNADGRAVCRAHLGQAVYDLMQDRLFVVITHASDVPVVV